MKVLYTSIGLNMWKMSLTALSRASLILKTWVAVKQVKYKVMPRALFISDVPLITFILMNKPETKSMAESDDSVVSVPITSSDS